MEFMVHLPLCFGTGRMVGFIFVLQGALVVLWWAQLPFFAEDSSFRLSMRRMVAITPLCKFLNGDVDKLGML
jgi:hypothetical protein